MVNDENLKIKSLSISMVVVSSGLYPVDEIQNWMQLPSGETPDAIVDKRPADFRTDGGDKAASWYLNRINHC